MSTEHTMVTFICDMNTEAKLSRRTKEMNRNEGWESLGCMWSVQSALHII